MLKRTREVFQQEGFVGITRRVLMRLRWPGAVRSVYGPLFVANHRDGTFRMYLRGTYGSFYWDRIKAFNAPFIFLDIGANQGLYTIGAASNENCVLAVALEPVPRTFSLLQKNLRLNGVVGKTKAIDAAISNRSGFAEMRMNANHSGGATLASGWPLEGELKDQQIHVWLISGAELDQLLPRMTYPIMVKIDVEGFEPVVIEELLHTCFAKRIYEIFLEINEDWVDVALIRDRLCGGGFSEQRTIGSGSHYDLLAQRPLSP